MGRLADATKRVGCGAEAPGGPPDLCGAALAVQKVVVHDGLRRGGKVRRRGPGIPAALPEGLFHVLGPAVLSALCVDNLVEGPLACPAEAAPPDGLRERVQTGVRSCQSFRERAHGVAEVLPLPDPQPR